MSTEINQSIETASPFSEVLTYWDQRIRNDLSARMSKHDRKWAEDELLVRNTDEGQRHGNLCSEFMRLFSMRFLANNPTIKVSPDDPDYKSKAVNATIVAQSVIRVADLKEQLFEAFRFSSFAGVGWLEVGHPQDPWCLDVMRSNRSPGLNPSVNVSEEGTGLDEYEAIDVKELESYGIDPNTAQPFNPFEAPPSPKEEVEPLPLFNASFGYPYVQAVDPRLIVVPMKVRDQKDCDYICRLRWLTRKELKHLIDYEYPGKTAIRNEWKTLFQVTENEDPQHFPEMMLIAQLYIIRDRNNPEYNSWTFCFPLGEPENLIYKGPNKDGGMVPLVAVKPFKLKRFYDTSLARELRPFANVFDNGIKAMFRDINRMLNKKWKGTNQAGIAEPEEKKLNNDNFTGVIRVNDPAGLQELDEKRFDHNLFQGLNFIKGQAQSATGTSDIDNGKAVKDITARQTQALLESTGLNIDGMKGQVQDAAKDVAMKLMHLIGLYNHLGTERKYQFGNRFTSMERGTHDFTTSMIYDVEVLDNKISISNEERIVWTQLLKTLLVDTGGLLRPYINLEELAASTIRKFGESNELLAVNAPPRPPLGLPTDPAGMPGEPPVSGNLLPFPGATQADQVFGQHPEREMGSRGLNISNALTGAGRIGS